MALILRYFTEFVIVSGAHCINVVDLTKPNYGQFTITMSSSKRLQTDCATPTAYIPSRFINSRLDEQYLPSYCLGKKSYMSFRLVPKLVTGAHCVKVVDKAITMDNLRLRSKRLQRDRATPTV